MVTGDRLEVAEPIGMSLGIDQVFADRTPAEKLEVVNLPEANRYVRRPYREGWEL